MEEPRVAVVTGGASEIGLAIVEHFARDRASVIAVDCDEAACEAAHHRFLQGGRLRRDSRGRHRDGARGSYSRSSDYGAPWPTRYPLNNAAVHPLALIEEHDLKSWQETFRVNVEGTMLCSRTALPHMKKQGNGTIVNIGSVGGISPYSGGGAYAASKAAVSMLTRVLALEVGPLRRHGKLHRAGRNSAQSAGAP